MNATGLFGGVRGNFECVFARDPNDDDRLVRDLERGFKTGLLRGRMQMSKPTRISHEDMGANLVMNESEFPPIPRPGPDPSLLPVEPVNDIGNKGPPGRHVKPSYPGAPDNTCETCTVFRRCLGRTVDATACGIALFGTVDGREGSAASRAQVEMLRP